LPDKIFHLLVSNPPYIDLAVPHLQRGDLRFEPRKQAENNGLAAFEIISAQAKKCPMALPNGYLFFNMAIIKNHPKGSESVYALP
jgi:methylase of polypeptide subunit release factors